MQRKTVSEVEAMRRILDSFCVLSVVIVLLLPIATQAVTYGYDSLNRLTSVVYDNGREIHYKYDRAGNVIWVAPTAYVTAATPAGDPRFLGLRGSYPNPFSHTATILFEIRAPQKVGAKVYDLRGRQVTSLPAVPMEPGVRRIVWGGTDARGATVASGVYFVRVETEHARQSLRVLLVR
jgi:YD repeat-containing protein